MSRMLRKTLALLAMLMFVAAVGQAAAQGVTTAEMTGLVKDAQGAAVPGVTVTAVHEPSGTTYVAITQADGRFFIPSMRIGGPYAVTAALSGFKTESRKDIMLNLGVAQDLGFTLSVQGVAETVTVVGEAAAVFSSGRTGAATAVTRDDLNQLPTVAGRINDITRLAPQAGSNGSFMGQDAKLNNITVDGSYFNNTFGLGGSQPGDRTNVAPISLEAVEQIQVSIAPYDVRQGNFVGAGVNVVTRSGTNKLTGSYYSRYRNESFVGKEARGQAFNPGTFTTKTNGAYVGGAIVKNKLFVFGSFEKQEDVRPLSTFRANLGGEPVGGSVTRVLASDLDTLSAFLKTNFNYETGPYNNISGRTPAKPFLVKLDYNLNSKNRVNFRYSQLSSSADKLLSGSNSAGVGRGNTSTNFLGFANSNYAQLENYKSGISEWNSVIGNSMSNNFIVGYTTNNESRGTPQFFPFVDILDGAGSAYTSFGPDPFTRNNELYYHTFQIQDSFTRFARSHTLTGGFSAEKYHSDNVFFQLSNSAYTYNTLADFYADANGYLANKNRTSSPVTLRRFQLGYMNVPSLEKPLQQIDSWYIGGYVQDQWAMRPNVSITAGLRMDTPFLSDKTTFNNPVANALVFLDEKGQSVQYNTGNLPDAKPLWSPRLGFNWDVFSNQTLQVRGGTGVFTGKPAYVWLSNQIGNTGLLLGAIDDNPPTASTFRGFNPDTLAYKPVVTGASAASYAVNVTDPNFKFPQVWRSNIAVDKQLPHGLIATGEFVYNRDVNGVYYINANLPAPQSAFTGLDTRPRWVGTACSSAGNKGGCVTRINAEPGNVVNQAFVLKNQNVGSGWVASGSLTKSFFHGFTAKTAYSYGESRNTVDAGSTASGTFNGIAHASNPNNPGIGLSQNSPGHRYYLNVSYTKQYFGLGATTVSAFWEARTNSNNFATNGSYVFAGDMNGDSVSNNDLIYVPRDQSEMNFAQFTAGGVTYTPAAQADAFEAYIKQDPYLKNRRGQYAERNAVFLPLVKRMDLSITQDVFGSAAGAKHTGQVRLDVTNFGNLLNHNWGVGQRFTVSSSSSSLNLVPILTNVTVDAAGKYSYRMAVVNNALAASTFSTTTFSNDVYTMMLSFRYNFN